MSMPNEILLDVLHFLDYSSLLRTKFATSTFLHVIVRNQEILAPPQKLCLTVEPADVRIDECPVRHTLPRPEPKTSGPLDVALAVAVVSAALNPIALVHLWCESVTTGAVDKAFDAIPAANYASELYIHHADRVSLSATQLLALTKCFRKLKSIFLWDIPEDFDWTILRSSCVLRLSEVYVDRSQGDHYAVFDNEAAEAEIICFISNSSSLESNHSKMLTFDFMFSKSFTTKIVKAVAASSGRVTVSFPAMLDLEEKEVTGYDEPLIYPLMDLDDAEYEYKVLNVMEENDEGVTWANVAYFSRRSTMAVFIRQGDDVTVTNAPDKAAERQNPDRRW